MRRLIFEPEHDAFRDSARRFFQREIGPHAERWRRQGYVDREAYRKAGEQGYLLMWADERHGGAGIADFRYEQILSEENVRYGEPAFYWMKGSSCTDQPATCRNTGSAGCSRMRAYRASSRARRKS